MQAGATSEQSRSTGMSHSRTPGVVKPLREHGEPRVGGLWDLRWQQVLPNVEQMERRPPDQEGGSGGGAVAVDVVRGERDSARGKGVNVRADDVWVVVHRVPPKVVGEAKHDVGLAGCSGGGGGGVCLFLSDSGAREQEQQ